MPVEEWVGRFAPVKPAFIHHPRTKGLIRDILVEMGCDADETYMDVPRLRGVTSDGYLTSGVGYAHHPHRDTWYSAPMAQLNWWLPIYPFETSSMAFPPLLGRGRRERLGELQLLRVEPWSAARTPRSTSRATRKQPKAEQHVELEPQVRVASATSAASCCSPPPTCTRPCRTRRPRPVQHRLPHGEPGRPAGRRHSQRRLVAHRQRRCATCVRPTRPYARRRRGGATTSARPRRRGCHAGVPTRCVGRWRARGGCDTLTRRDS